MALVESSMMSLGTKAPDFHLEDSVSNKMYSVSDLKSEVATVVVFICNHCPFVHHINEKLVELASNHQEKGLRFIAISSNDVETYPEDGPVYMKQVAAKENYPFPYLYDPTQEVAKAYGAECTPDFFVFDAAMKCVYRGRMDETRPNKGQPTGEDLSAALDCLLAGNPVNPVQLPSVGCSIKWRS